jgi:hypothetical protein
MKKLTFISALLGLAVLFTNCEEKDDSPKVDFEIIVTGESPNAVVAVINTSDEADSYTWTFSEGADIETSTAVSQQVTVDKVGDFTVTLTALTGDDEKSKSKTVNITGIGGINVFEDVHLGTVGYEDSIGIYFSCETGISYLETGLTNALKSTIDFVLESYVSTIIYSPNNYTGNPIMGHRKTWFNGNEDKSFTIADFDTMSNELPLLSLSEANEFYVRTVLDDMPRVILMKDYEGKWGAIKIKEVDEYKVTLDVKMQKYLPEE